MYIDRKSVDIIDSCWFNLCNTVVFEPVPSLSLSTLEEQQSLRGGDAHQRGSLEGLVRGPVRGRRTLTTISFVTKNTELYLQVYTTYHFYCSLHILSLSYESYIIERPVSTARDALSLQHLPVPRRALRDGSLYHRLLVFILLTAFNVVRIPRRLITRDSDVVTEQAFAARASRFDFARGEDELAAVDDEERKLDKTQIRSPGN